MNINNFENVIREAVRIESQNDSNWDWYVELVSDNKVAIRWGYLDYLKESLNIVIRVDDVYSKDNDEYIIIGRLPSGSEFSVLVGNHFWDDCETLEEGFRMVIRGVAELAKKIY